MSRRRKPKESPAPDQQNAAKRWAYANVPGVKEDAKAAARERYRGGNPLAPSRLNRGLLTTGLTREVSVVNMRRLRRLETFTIPESAAALGKSLPNFRRWINNDLIPAPYLKDRERGHFCYSVEELRIMARILSAHEQEFAYFCAKHETTANSIYQAIHGYRQMTFGADAITEED